MANYLRPSRPLDARDAAAALIVVDGSHYLMQQRDDRADIYYPGYWGLFGGAVDEGETPIEALRREIKEEIDLDPGEARYFTRFDFDMSGVGRRWLYRVFYVIELRRQDLLRLRLREGKSMKLFEPGPLLGAEKVVPYDAFALWLHAHRLQLDPRLDQAGRRDHGPGL
ncbi:MAG: NUDIX domain-containing protein [Alphaproteobacteria bacterium]